ncbi:MAG: metal ABC transporter substrate-binding protein [Pseudomonadota bacterium]|nr:metal ABC transporter substrate-binding protein [Pseudomonadota bacterium]
MRLLNSILIPVILSTFNLSAVSALAELNVVTTTTDLRAITNEVGQKFINVNSIAKGTQDPHFIEAKPSYMTKVSKADLLIAIGLDLEVGWLPSLIRGARNPKINQGQKGYLEVGTFVKPLEIPIGRISRADGDVHPFGNPHVTLDPIRTGEIALKIAERLGELDSANTAEYQKNALALQLRMQKKTKEWQQRIQAAGIKKAVTYHRTLTYFLDRFQIENPVILEPKPGIPPTSAHILKVIDTIKKDQISLILVENYFAPTVTEKIKQTIPSIRSATVPVAVDGAEGIATIDDLYENLVKGIVDQNNN